MIFLVLCDHLHASAEGGTPRFQKQEEIVSCDVLAEGGGRTSVLWWNWRSSRRSRFHMKAHSTIESNFGALICSINLRLQKLLGGCYFIQLLLAHITSYGVYHCWRVPFFSLLIPYAPCFAIKHTCPPWDWFMVLQECFALKDWIVRISGKYIRLLQEGGSLYMML